MSKIGKLIRDARKAKGWSQQELGQRAGMPQSHISLIESGQTDPRYTNVLELVRLLGFDMVLVPRAKLSWVQSIVDGEDADLRPRFLPDDELDDEYE